MDDKLAGLIAAQSGLVARRQLRWRGVDWDRVRDNVAAGRWAERTPRVVSTFTGELTWEQRQWMALLHAGPRSMLGSLTAAGRHGLDGWDRPHVSVYVDDELSFEPVAGVEFFRTRRPYDVLRARRPGIPVCRVEPAVLLFAGYEAPPRAAHAVLAAVVQQRLTTVDRMVHWLDVLRPLRRAKAFRQTLGDIAGGAHSGAELDVRRMCRRFGLALPDGQRSRTDRAGRRRWTDAEWRLPDGRVLILEIDGGPHLEPIQSMHDNRRARRLTTPDRIVVRASAYEVRHEPEQVVADLTALGVPRRVPDNAA